MELQAAYGQCLHRLRIASRHLGLSATEERLGRICELVVQPLTGPWRLYHTIEHIFEVGGDDDPLEMVAALFHDVVYIQVDLSVNFNLARYLTPYVREVKPLAADMQEGLVIRDRCEVGEDPLFELVCTVFGIAPGDRLAPHGGQNEFLSALVAAKVLEGVFPPAVIAQIVACVEATIPFRAIAADGEHSCSDRLYGRLRAANDGMGLGLDEQALHDAVRRAVRLANRDVEGFAVEDPGVFLDNTWNLLPETNHALLASSAYTVRDYRVSLQRMRGFLLHLDPRTVFQRFDDEPPAQIHRERIERVRRNLQVAARYLGAKYVAIAFLEALAMRIGPDLPLSLLMGSLPAPGVPPGPTLEGFLPPRGGELAGDVIDETVFALLERGRATAVSYDLRHSPLASFLARALGLGALLELLPEAERLLECFDSAATAEQKRGRGEAFLQRFPAPVRTAVSEAARKVFAHRAAALLG
jgi:hypothetical protein